MSVALIFFAIAGYLALAALAAYVAAFHLDPHGDDDCPPSVIGLFWPFAVIICLLVVLTFPLRWAARKGGWPL
jgi:hypothetical protein